MIVDKNKYPNGETRVGSSLNGIFFQISSPDTLDFKKDNNVIIRSKKIEIDTSNIGIGLLPPAPVRFFGKWEIKQQVILIENTDKELQMFFVAIHKTKKHLTLQFGEWPEINTLYLKKLTN